MPKDTLTIYREQGRLGEYVYHCVQGRRNLEEREKLIVKYKEQFGLSESDMEYLRAQLAELDARRLAQQPPPPPPAWHNDPPTQKQLDYLSRCGFKGRKPSTKREAQRLILEHKRLLDEFDRAADDSSAATHLAEAMIEEWEGG